MKTENSSSYTKTIQLGREGRNLALALLKECYLWVVKNGADKDFAARRVLGGIPVLNLKTLSANSILAKVGSSRRGHRAYYRMVDPAGVQKALREMRFLP